MGRPEGQRSKTAARHRHDARFLGAQVDRIGWPGTFDGGVGRLAPGLPAGSLGLRVPRRKLSLMFGLLALKAFPSARFDPGSGRGELCQTLLAARQFLRDRQAVWEVRPVGHFGLQWRRDPAGMLIAQRAVAAGVGVDLGAIQRHRAHPQQTHLARQFQHLDEQPLDLLQEPAPERREGGVVRLLVGRDEAERHRIIGRPLQLAARKHPCGVAIDQEA
jgi:hypothetical protein